MEQQERHRPVGRHGFAERDVADAIVGIMRRVTGRGPDNARVVTDGETIVVMLGESLSKGEQALVDGGQVDAVLALRRAYQEVLRPEFVAAVEEITGRVVTAFMSANHTIPDKAAEIFTLGDVRPMVEPA